MVAQSGFIVIQPARIRNQPSSRHIRGCSVFTARTRTKPPHLFLLPFHTNIIGSVAPDGDDLDSAR
jgi:hypothetical protein